MAAKRMFDRDLVVSDLFLSMSAEARALYMALGVIADDDGFVSSPIGVMRQCGAPKEAMDELIENNYIIPFDSGIIAIRHWRRNNSLRSDRYKMSNCIRERAMLTVDVTGAYEMAKPGDPPIPVPGKGEDGNQPKDGPSDIGKNTADPFASFAGDNSELLSALNDFAAMRKAKGKALSKPTKQALVNELKELSSDPAEQTAIVNRSIAGGWARFFPLRPSGGCGAQSQSEQVSTAPFDYDSYYGR